MGSALAHGVVIVALPAISLAPLELSIDASIDTNDGLSVTLIQVSQPAVDERHPTRRPLFDPQPEIAKPVDSSVIPEANAAQIEVQPQVDQAAVPQVATAEIKQPSVVSSVIAQPEVAEVSDSKVTDATAPIETPPETKAPARTQAPQQRVKAEPQEPMTTPVVEIASSVPETESVETESLDSEDELEDDDSAPYVEHTTAAPVVPAAPVAVVMQSTPETPLAADTATTTGGADSDTTVATTDVELVSVSDTPALTQQLAAAPKTLQSIEPTDTFDESLIRREIRARFDHDLVYPPLARKRGWEGNVDVMLRISRHGNIEVLEVVESSGFGILDRYTRKTLEHIRLDDQFLESLQGRHRDLRIEVQYHLIAARG